MTSLELWSKGYTLKQLTITYDSKLLSSWDHTSQVVAGIYNLTVAVVSIVSKGNKPKPQPPNYFHPFRETKKTGLAITNDNFTVLRSLGNALCSK